MHPILFKIGGAYIYSYGFMVALAFLVGIFVSMYFAEKEGLSAETILDLATYVILSSIVGARLFYVIGQWHVYKDNLLEIFMVQKGGLVILGGILLSLLVIALYAKRKKIPSLKLFDVISPGVALAIVFGRIGCFLNGCCFGLPTNVSWGMVFPPGSLAYSYFPGEHIHPTQLYSSFAMLIVFILVVIIYQRKKYDGYLFFWALILYSLYRFSVEFFRYSPMHWLGLTPSQWIVLLIAIVAVFNLVKRNPQSIR